MATTFTLKRKYFAEQQGEKKGMSSGKKIGLAAVGTTALAAGTALAAMRGKGKLTKNSLSSFKNFKGAVKETFGKEARKASGGLFKEGGALSGKNLVEGFKGLGQGAANVGKQGFGKVKSWFGKGKN